ncbi:hypothetical protein THO17_21580 [Marinomonas sp. THO17]
MTIISSLIFITLFTHISTPFELHAFQPISIFLTNSFLLIYLRFDPKKRVNQVIKIYGYILLIVSVLNTLYYTTRAWQGEMSFIENFPPISGMTILTMTLIMLMIPEKLNKLIILTWTLNALPVLLLLATHPEELQTPRGYDLLFLFGPASLLVLLIIPYQRSLKSHMDKIHFDLKNSREEADRDFLTDVFNRRGLNSWLNELEDNSQISIMLIDIDHFKSINDKFGHDIGDHVLIEFASRLRTVYHGTHALARWGGEEFIVVIVNSTRDKIQIVSEMFRTALSQLPYKEVGKITASIGVSQVNSIDGFSTMVKEADTALYIAKNHGRDQVVMYTGSLTKDLLSDLAPEKN